MSTVISMDNKPSLSSMPTEVLVKMLCCLPDLQTVASSNLTCHHIHDVCAANTKAITDAFIASIKCSELAIQYYGVPLQFAGRRGNAHHRVNPPPPPPRLPLQRSRIQHTRKMLALAEIGHRAQKVYLTQMDGPAAINPEIWQSIFYQALILSSTIQRRELQIGLYETKVALFHDLDILTLSQISDMYATLAQLCFFSRQQTDNNTGGPGRRDTGWLEYEGLPFHDWQHMWYSIFCIRSYLCDQHAWSRDWTCGIRERGDLMTRRESCCGGKLVQGLVDGGSRVVDVKRDGYAQLLEVSFRS